MRQVECGFRSLPDTLVLFGSTTQVQIGFDSNFNPTIRPNIPDQLYNALIDTGASDSCIDSGIAESLNLPAIDNRPVSGVHLHAGGQVHSVLLGRTFFAEFQNAL